MKKTNIGLVKYVKTKLGCPYWYGTFGQIASASLLNAKIKQYPWYYNKSRIARCKTQYGKQVFDCVGLIKSYIWLSADDKIVYNAKQDVSANGMLEKCKEKGSIKTLPEIPGVLLFMDGHVGVYIGGGYAIEATVGRSEYKVKKSKVQGRGWTHWGKCPYITYETSAEIPEKPTSAEKPVKKPTNEKADKDTPKPQKSENTVKYLSCKGKYNGFSLVDALKSIKYDASYPSRRNLAKKNGIKIYFGTASQNIKLLNLLKQGKLIK